MRYKPDEFHQHLAECVLHLRRRNANSRSSLARALNISASTMGMYADTLIERGWVRESGQELGHVGRPKRLLRPCADAGWFAGIEFHGGGIWGVAVDFAGKVITRYHEFLPPNLDAEQVLASIQKVFYILSSGLKSKLLGVGIGAPGLVNAKDSVALHYPFVKNWENVPLSRMLPDLEGVPVRLEQGLRAIALAERLYGLQHRLMHYVILGARFGFGAAIVHNGQLATGAKHAAGEIGCWPFPQRGGEDIAALLSGPATYRRLAGLPREAPVPVNLSAAFGELRQHAPAARAEVARDFACVIGCLQLLLDPEVFVLHGPISQLGDEFSQEIIQSIETEIPALRGLAPRVEATALGEEAGALGAACLAIENWQPQ
jgi:predicted NBD/HSP70 family sugar kinase